MENMKLFCPNCGAENDRQSTFCENCGADLTTAKEQVEAAEAERNKANQPVIYQHATELAEKGDFRNAAALFAKLGDYEDSREKAVANQALVDVQNQREQAAQQQQAYEAAMTAFTEGDLVRAQAGFAQLGDYEDAQQKLGLVQKALTQQQQQIQAQNQEQAYQAALDQAHGAQQSGALQNALNVLSQFSGYKDADDQVVMFAKRLAEMQAAEQAQWQAHRKQVKRIGAIVGAVVILLVIGGGWFAYHAHTVSALKIQVTQQRQSNAKSFRSLPNTTQQDIRDMVTTYHGNANDYTYSLKQKTANYNIVTYQFVGPDPSKDVLPKSGTRTYNQTAINRQ